MAVWIWVWLVRTNKNNFRRIIDHDVCWLAIENPRGMSLSHVFVGLGRKKRNFSSLFLKDQPTISIFFPSSFPFTANSKQHLHSPFSFSFFSFSSFSVTHNGTLLLFLVFGLTQVPPHFPSFSVKAICKPHFFLFLFVLKYKASFLHFHAPFFLFLYHLNSTYFWQTLFSSTRHRWKVNCTWVKNVVRIFLVCFHLVNWVVFPTTLFVGFFYREPVSGFGDSIVGV